MKGISAPRSSWRGWFTSARRVCLPFIPHPSSLIPPKSLILLGFCVSLFFQGIGSRELWASHEARAAQNAQRMLDDGSWLLPRLYDDQVELQKPPGFYWLVAAVGAARGGVDAWAVRLPAALAGTLTVLLVWWHLHRRGRPVAAFAAGAVLAGAVHFTGTARIGRIDVPLACAVAGIMVVSRDALAERGAGRPGRARAEADGEPGCVNAGSAGRGNRPLPGSSAPGAHATGLAVDSRVSAPGGRGPRSASGRTHSDGRVREGEAPAEPRAPRLGRSLALPSHRLPRLGRSLALPSNRLWHTTSASRLTGPLIIGLLAGAALLLKGPIGLVLPVAALGAFYLIERLPVRRLVLPALFAGAVALAVAAPWFLWATAETDGRFFRVFFLYHHLNRAFGGAETLASHPWWHYLPRLAADFLPWTPLLIAALIARRWRGDPDARFGLVWLVVMVAVLSVPRFKRADYLLPAYPGAALFLGCALERWYLSRTPGGRKRAAWAFGLTLALLPAGWVVFDHLVTAREEAARAQAPFAARIREVAPAPEPVILFRVESHLLAYHLGRPVHTLVEWADLRARVRPFGPHYVVTRAEFLDEVRQTLAVPLEVVARTDHAGRAHRPLVLLRFPGETCPPNPPRD